MNKVCDCLLTDLLDDLVDSVFRVDASDNVGNTLPDLLMSEAIAFIGEALLRADVVS